MKKFLREWLGIKEPKSREFLDREERDFIRGEVLREITSFFKVESYDSLRFMTSVASHVGDNMINEARKEGRLSADSFVKGEEFLDGIVERLRRKQLGNGNV